MQSEKIGIDASLVQRLIAAQFPQWHDLPIRPVGGRGGGLIKIAPTPEQNSTLLL